MHTYFFVEENNRKRTILCVCNEHIHYTTPIRWRVLKVSLKHQRSHIDHLTVLLALTHNMTPFFDHSGGQSILCLVSNGLKVVLVCKDCKAIALVSVISGAIFTHQTGIDHLTRLTASHCPRMVVFIQLLPLPALCTAEATTWVSPHRELVANDTRNSLKDYIRILYR